MFLLVGLIGLIIAIFVRPFELFEELRGLPLLYLLVAAAIIGYMLDLRTGLGHLRVAKSVWLAIGFFVWALVATLISAPEQLSSALLRLSITFASFLLIATGVHSLFAFERVAAVVLGCALVIGTLCIHQGFQAKQCVLLEHGGPAVSISGVGCSEHAQCPDSGAYRGSCEHVGAFELTSVNGRVRYTGILQDPNEVAMLVSSALPLALAFRKRRTNRNTGALVAFAFAVAVATVALSGSRGGQLVLATVLGAEGIQRLGLLRASLASAPVATLAVLIQGLQPERADGDESSMKRLGCMLSGINMVVERPLFGVGVGQFTEFHDQTAHNAYILAGAETGFPGMVLWTLALYASVSHAGAASRSKTASGPASRIWTSALNTSLIGLAVGIFFLSFAYHMVLWVFLGLGAALHNVHAQGTGTMAAQHWGRELGLVATVCLGVLVSVWVYASAQLS